MIKTEDINPIFSFQDDFKISDVAVDQIIDQYHSPIYIYDASIIRDQYRKLRKAMPEKIDIFYAMKPNPTRAIVELLVDQGAGVEVASIGDLVTCQQIGVDPRLRRPCQNRQRAPAVNRNGNTCYSC